MKQHLRYLRAVLPEKVKHIADFEVVIAYKAGVSAFQELYAVAIRS